MFLTEKLCLTKRRRRTVGQILVYLRIVWITSLGFPKNITYPGRGVRLFIGTYEAGQYILMF